MAKVLVTGAAGFVGFHLSQKLLDRGDQVVGLDNLTPYYDVSLKTARLKLLRDRTGFEFHLLDLVERDRIAELLATGQFDSVVHLAAQAGVRYSIDHPHVYGESNLVGFLNVLEGCRYGEIKHLVFASSSSVYGANTKLPFSTRDRVDHPISLYAATKRANELMAHTYSHLYRLPTTGLRFFTVYGPWGRPDMALFSFTKAILEGRPIDLFNYGKMKRDFTYVDDIVQGVIRVLDRTPRPVPDWSSDSAPSASNAPYKLYNIGNNQPVELLRFVEVLESCLGISAKKNLLPMQPGDVFSTYADVEDLAQDTGFRPSTSIETGIQRFVEWYRSFYSV
jgi:UDP-glucuronate 4-epimerase